MTSVKQQTSRDVPAQPVVLPATARGRQRRAAIVEAAAMLMYERGIAATSLDEVLARSGAGKSQFYHYFGDKNDLLRTRSIPMMPCASTWPMPLRAGRVTCRAD